MKSEITMRVSHLFVSFAATLLLAVAFAVSAQSPDTASITVTVVDPNDAVVLGG